MTKRAAELTRLDVHPQAKHPRGEECCCYREKLFHNWVVYYKIQMHWFLKVDGLGETRCEKSWDRFEEYGSLSLRYVNRVGKERTIVGKYKSQTSTSVKSLRYEI